MWPSKPLKLLTIPAAAVCLGVVSSLMVPATARAEVEAEGEAPSEAGERPTLPDDTFELSFGDSSLFAPEERAAEIKQIVATESVLFIGEWFFHYRWHLIAAFNLPTAPELSFVDGELIQEFSPPTLSLGLLWTPVSWEFDDTEGRRLEWQLSAMAGMTMKFRRGDPPVVFPLVASRIALLHESDVSIYLGGAFALRLDTAALIYGIGYRF